MVYSFLIHTVLPGDCKILYSRTTGQLNLTVSDITGTVNVNDTPPNQQEATESTSCREVRKRLLENIAQEVQSQYSFKVSVTGKSYEEDLDLVNNSGVIPALELGYARVRDCVTGSQNSLCLSEKDQEKVVLWMAAVNCGFTLVLDPTENRMNAESVLKLVIKHLHTQCQVFTRPNDISLKPDKVDIIVDQLIPGGTLLFMNHRVVRQFEKELEIKIKNIIP